MCNVAYKRINLSQNDHFTRIVLFMADEKKSESREIRLYQGFPFFTRNLFPLLTNLEKIGLEAYVNEQSKGVN